MSDRSQTRNSHPDLDEQLARLAMAQRNLTPEDQLHNGQSVDDAFWNGFERPKGIQRAGLLVYSSFMLLMTLAFVGIGLDQHIPFMYCMALLPTAIAIKVGINAFRPRKNPRLI